MVRGEVGERAEEQQDAADRGGAVGADHRDELPADEPVADRGDRQDHEHGEPIAAHGEQDSEETSTPSAASTE